MNENSSPNEPTLKNLIEASAVRDQDLSQRIGVGMRVIGYWKKGEKIPRLDNAVSLARELNVSLKTLCRSMGLDVTGIPDEDL